MDPIVAILAGGRSRRMGAPKPGVPLAGEPLISYPLAAAAAAGLEAIVIAKPDSELPPLGRPVVREPAQPRHPLCGIVAALRAVHPAPVIAVAADMPFVADGLLRWLARRPSTTAVEAGGKLQPLLAHYGSDSLAPLEAALAAGEPLTAALRGLAPRLVGERELRRFGNPELLCLNVNTPADLARAEGVIRSRRPA